MNPTITILSLSATSVSLSWSQPEFSLPVVEYTVSLTRVTGSGQTLCPTFEDSRPAVATTGNLMSFTDLEEFSAYMVSIIALYSAFNSTSLESSTLNVNTATASKIL